MLVAHCQRKRDFIPCPSCSCLKSKKRVLRAIPEKKINKESFYKRDAISIVNLEEFFSDEFLLGNSKSNSQTKENQNNQCQENSVSNKNLNMENVEIQFNYVESSQNFQGNYQNYVTNAFQSIAIIRTLNFSSILNVKKILLPESDSSKKTLILDLDETLIHADFDQKFASHDQLISFNYNGNEVTVPINLRPGLLKFLENISENFEVFVFTASIKEYADTILNFLDPENKIFKNRFYREHCINVKNKVFIKDLRIFLNRKLENIIIVDNSLYSFANQISNGILINSFYDDKDDRELFNLFNYLQHYIFNSTDTRLVNESVFNFSSILETYSSCIKPLIR